MIRYAVLLLASAALVQSEDSLVVHGYQRFYNLDYDQALDDFSAYAALHPDDPQAFNHVAHAILYRDLFRSGALETEMVTGNNPFLRRASGEPPPADRQAFDRNIDRAMELARARLAKNPRDTEALYALGISHGLRANSCFLIRRAWRDALGDALAARRAHVRVSQIDPKNIDARLVQGLHDYVVGSLPLHLRALAFFGGVRGNREVGLRTVELVAAQGTANRVDAMFLLCALYRREHQPQLAIPLLRDLMGRFPENYLLRMELAQMYSDLHEPERALSILRELRGLQRAGAPGYRKLRSEKICFVEGNIQFWYNDLDSALDNLRRAAAASHELDLNTAVLAWMRVGQIYDLKGERRHATDAYLHAIGLAPDSGAARESRAYLDSPYRRARERAGS